MVNQKLIEELKKLEGVVITVSYKVYGIPHKSVAKLLQVTPEAIILEGLHPIYFKGPICIIEISSGGKTIYSAAHS